MAQITPTISNGKASIPVQSGPFYVATYYQKTVNGVAKNMLSQPPFLVTGQLLPVSLSIVAYTTWAEMASELTTLGIPTKQIIQPTS